jgi:purine-nucleoside phosphorylase
MQPVEIERLAETATFVQGRVRAENPLLPPPRVGVVLGSGLGELADGIEESVRILYAELPHHPASMVSGHAGRLCLGLIEGVPVACMQGRVHLYEGHDPARVVFGVRLLAELGCSIVLLSNAAGGIARELEPGDLMRIEDHLNLTGTSPLLGPCGRGVRFPDMTRAYDVELGAECARAAQELGIRLKTGVYAGLLGPSYETPAEIRMLSELGADAVGMSTVLEAIALRQLGVRVGAVSCITNLAAGRGVQPLNHREVELTAARAASDFVRLFRRWVTLAGAHAPARQDMSVLARTDHDPPKQA